VSAEPIWIAEADVVALMDMADAVRALEAGLLAEARGEAHNMTKTHVAWGRATLHALGAAFPKAGLAGTKTWAHTPEGATPLLLLYDAGTGALRAVVEAFALGQMRTAAASGVATRWLAAHDADELAVVGTGKQALAQVAGVAAVRRLRRVRVFGRDVERRNRFVDSVRTELGLEAEPRASVAEAVKDAAIITTVTRATEPFLSSTMVAPGTHVNAVGAITPAGAEVESDLVARCGRVVADSVPQAQKLSRELIARFGADPSGWTEVRSLAEVVADRAARRRDDEVTLFKSLGMGISDLALGLEVYRRAREQGRGRSLPAPVRVVPRLRPAGAREGVQSGAKRV
jgi:ornithine cyclodeaminase